MTLEHDKNDVYNRLIGVPDGPGNATRKRFFTWVKKGTRIFIYYKGIGIKKIVEVIDDSRNIYLVNDIVYHLIRFDGLECPLASNLSQEGKNIVDCDSLSKPFSLMGMRVGVLITRDREIFDAAAKIQQYTIVSPNVLACEIWRVVSDPNVFSDIKANVIELNKKLEENYRMFEGFFKRKGLRIMLKESVIYCGTCFLILWQEDLPISSIMFIVQKRIRS